MISRLLFKNLITTGCIQCIEYEYHLVRMRDAMSLLSNRAYRTYWCVPFKNLHDTLQQLRFTE